MADFNAYSLCRQAQAHYLAFISRNTADSVPQQIAEHIGQCGHCRGQIEQLSHILNSPASAGVVSQTKNAAEMLKMHFSYLGRKVTCNTVKPFLPALLDQALEIKIPTPITVHIDNCPNCPKNLETIRELNLPRVDLCRLSQMFAEKTKHTYIYAPAVQSAISEIIDHPESGIETVYYTIDSQDAKIPSPQNTGNLYSGFPINVEVSNAGVKKQITFPTAVTPGSARRFTPLVKFGGLAAAIAITALIFFLAKPAAPLKQIHKAVLNAKNVYIESFAPNSEPTGEKWFSRALGIYIIGSGINKELYDVKNGFKRTHAVATGQVVGTSLSAEEAAGTKMLLSSTLGLMPFENISELPAGSQWRRLADRNEQVNMPAQEVYDLLWTQKSDDGSEVSSKWRIFVNPENHLPARTEFYQKLPDKQEYILKSFNVISYPSNDEIRAIVKALF